MCSLVTEGYRPTSESQNRSMSSLPPPFLNPSETKTDGLAFIGLSLTRNHTNVVESNVESLTRQQIWDFNALQDRNYEFVASTNDDGWLVGGGESKVLSYKLPSRDSAHVEIMRVGSFETELGGITISEIEEAMLNGSVLIPEMKILPTSVVCNTDSPPEIEVRFDMESDLSGILASLTSYVCSFT